MTKIAQDWLDNTYKNKSVGGKIELHSWNPWVDSEILTGDLLIDSYINVEEIMVERWEQGKKGKSRGEITKVTVSNCPELKKLWLGNNKIKEIIFKDKLSNLTDLRLGDNQLTEIDISNLPALSVLILPYNYITDIKGMEYVTNLRVISLTNNPGFNGRQYREWGDAIKDILGIPLANPLPDTWQNDLKVKLDGLKNQPGQKELENKIKNLLGISVHDPLPSDWENQLVKKTDLDDANKKIKEYEDGLKAELGLNDSNLNTWRNEIAKLKNQSSSKVLEDKIKTVLGLKPTDNLPSDWDQKIVSKGMYDKVKNLHDLIAQGAKSKFGDDWKEYLEIKDSYDYIEQQIVQPSK